MAGPGAGKLDCGGVGILIQNKIACKFIDVVMNDKGSAIFLTLNIQWLQLF